MEKQTYFYTAQEHLLEEPEDILFLEDWIKEKINIFIETPQWTTLIFPQCLSANHRKFVHEYTQSCQLHSKSVGGKQERILFVHKMGLSQAEITKRQQKNWHDIPIGISRIIETQDLSFYLGSGVDVRKEYLLKRESIKYIINCSQKWETVRFPDIEYYNCYLPEKSNEDDYYDIEQIIREACSYMENCGVGGRGFYMGSDSKILIHCYDGRSKSVVLLIAYLLCYQNYTLLSAYNLIKSRRNKITPPTHLMKWLCHFEVLIRGGSPTMSAKDWNIRLSQNGQPEVKKGLAKAAKEEIALKWLPLEVLLKEAEGKVITAENLKPFIRSLLSKIQYHPEAQEDMKEMGFTWNEIIDTLTQRIRDWYNDKCELTNRSPGELSETDLFG